MLAGLLVKFSVHLVEGLVVTVNVVEEQSMVDPWRLLPGLWRVLQTVMGLQVKFSVHLVEGFRVAVNDGEGQSTVDPWYLSLELWEVLEAMVVHWPVGDLISLELDDERSSLGKVI